jgi:hypothetical protein
LQVFLSLLLTTMSADKLNIQKLNSLEVLPIKAANYTGLQNKFFSVTSTKVVELNSIFYAECKYVLSFSLSRKVFKCHTVII